VFTLGVMVPSFAFLIARLMEDSTKFVRITVAIETAGVAAAPFALARIRHRIESFSAWLRGESGANVEAAWASIVIDLPRIITAGVMTVAVFLAPAVLYIDSVLDLSLVGYLVSFPTVAVLLAMWCVFTFVFVQEAMRPAVRELAAALPADFAPVAARCGSAPSCFCSPSACVCSRASRSPRLQHRTSASRDELHSFSWPASLFRQHCRCCSR
jgi:hypothetical protein